MAFKVTEAGVDDVIMVTPGDLLAIAERPSDWEADYVVWEVPYFLIGTVLIRARHFSTALPTFIVYIIRL